MWEKYLQPVGIFSAGVFYKDLTDYIYIFQVDEVIDGEDYEVIQPRNGDKATLAGLEIAFQNQFTNWNGFWGGFGIYGNYTYIDSEAEYPDREPTFRASRSTSETSPSATRSTASRHGCRTTTTARSSRGGRRSPMKTSGSTITLSSTSCSAFRSRTDAPSSSRPSTSLTSPTPTMKAPPTGSAAGVLRLVGDPGCEVRSVGIRTTEQHPRGLTAPGVSQAFRNER